jgi:hypothetical protein
MQSPRSSYASLPDQPTGTDRWTVSRLSLNKSPLYGLLVFIFALGAIFFHKQHLLCIAFAVVAALFGLIGLTLCCRETGPVDKAIPLPCWAKTLSGIIPEDLICSYCLVPGKAPVYAVLLCVASLSAVYIREQHPEWHALFLLCTVASAIIGLALFCLGSFRIDTLGHTLGHRIDTLGHRVDTLKHEMKEEFRKTNKMILMTEVQKQALRDAELRADQRSSGETANETAKSTLSIPFGAEKDTLSSDIRNNAAAGIVFGTSPENKDD